MTQKGSTIVQTKSGKVRGMQEDGLYVFKGIPYAAPPVGELRWMPPQPVQRWSGIRSADKFGTIAPQDTTLGTAFPGQKPFEEPQSEDCLFLNVWTPDADDSKRAVMVWIHGGAFHHGSGSSPMHPGKTLAKRGDLVVVTINYRLGPLGFLPLKQLTNGKIQASGNEALFDQIAALRWVQENISAFGGDPDNVTVFGESAGAVTIGALLAMPESKGLFRKAILQSGASMYRPLEDAVKVAERYLGILGLKGNDIEALMALTPARLLAAQKELGMADPPPGVKGVNLRPVVDGETLREVPLDGIEHGSAKDITILAGSNLEEGKLFGLAFPNMKDMDEAGLLNRLRQLLPEEYILGLIENYRKALAKRDLPVTPYKVYVAIQGDQLFRLPNIRLCEIQERLNTPSYGYVFTWKSAAPGLGACHALDVGFVFGNLTPEFHGCGPEAEKLAENMQDAWIAFAKTGNPSCPGLGSWAPYGKSRKMMVLGEYCHIETAPYEDERAAWDGVPNKLLG